jgi:hypothetical protein
MLCALYKTQILIVWTMEKVEYLEFFTQVRLAVPYDNMDCDSLHLDVAVKEDQELSDFQYSAF